LTRVPRDGKIESVALEEVTLVAYIEHANITVPDIDAAIKFLQTLEPKLKVRHDETPPGKRRWAHIGLGNCYIALQEPQLKSEARPRRTPYSNYGVNHIGWVVDDFATTIERLEAAGYEPSITGECSQMRRRAYYYDSSGFEWEIVAYYTDDLSQRYSYK
jgi:catechol 2,3-dioxygenase-like lactoylglutathione lyase family enzyme